MSRIAKKIITIPSDVSVQIKNSYITVQGNQGTISKTISSAVTVDHKNNIISVHPIKDNPEGWAQAGTTRSIVYSMVYGVKFGFTKKLKLFGVGYRVTLTKNTLTLFLGFSHPVVHVLPQSIKVICPAADEICLTSADKQLVGQVAAELRAYRAPEPYKGKGVRYANEKIQTKEPKKK